MANLETGGVTGTGDNDHDLSWLVESCLSSTLRFDLYRRNAERQDDDEFADLYRRAHAARQRGAQQGKTMLAHRIGA